MKQSDIDVIKNICSVEEMAKRKIYIRKTQSLPALDIALLQKLAEKLDMLQVATETAETDGTIKFV